MNIKWEEGAPAPVIFCNHTAVWLNGLVYVGSGYETKSEATYTINSYNPVNSSWNSPINAPYFRFAMTTLNNKLLIVGGEDISYKRTDQILTTDAYAGQFKKYTKMITARSCATAVGLQGMLIITGGRGGMDVRGNILSSTELFDSNNGQWYKCSDLPQPHYWLKWVIVDNILYLLGGTNKYYIYSPAVFAAPLDTLSTHQLKWNAEPDTPWCGSTPVCVNSTHLLILGGLNNGKYTSDIQKFDKVNHSWETIGHIPSARFRSAAVSITDDRVIVIGGEDYEREYTNTVWIGSCESQ